jgi:hypothetical protein
MPIGRPDWYNVGQSNVIDTMSDMAELAVRLGSPVNYDRSGKTIVYDVFDRLDGLYTITDNNAITLWSLENSRLEYGANSLYTQLNINEANWSRVTRDFRLWGGKYLSLEISLNYDYVPHQIVFSFNTYFEDVLRTVSIQLTDDLTTLNVYDSTGTFQTFDTLSAEPTIETIFNVLRLIYDIENNQFVAFAVNNTIWGLTDYDLRTQTSVAVDHLYFALTVYGHATQALQCWLDRLIISEDL